MICATLSPLIHAGADVMKMQFIELNAMGVEIPDEIAQRFTAWLDVTESIHSAAERLKGLSDVLLRSGRERQSALREVAVRSLQSNSVQPSGKVRGR